ncbi:MAG: NAD(P)-dependent oxidoreductase, partial [Actinomycetota bacterium]
MLDAPVSGGERGAIEAALSIMVGGDDEAFKRATPVFEVLGKNIVHIGPSGAGQVAKACNQLIVGATIQAVGEALVLAAKAGVDPAIVREALLGGFAGSKILEVHGRRMLDGDFAPGFRAALHRKDARIVLETAEVLGSPVPSFAVAASAFEALGAAGRGDLDHAALVTLLEEEAGVEVGDPTSRRKGVTERDG